MRGDVQASISMAIAGMDQHGNDRVLRLVPGDLPLRGTNRDKPLMASRWALIAIPMKQLSSAVTMACISYSTLTLGEVHWLMCLELQ